MVTGVGEREWLYARELNLDMEKRNQFFDLVFEGLDTICDVYLVCTAPMMLFW